MINLYESLIFENQTLKDTDISLELFIKYFDNDTEAIKEVIKIFKKKFGDKGMELKNVLDSSLRQITSEISQMHVELDDVILKFIYTKLQKTALSKIDKIIGSGEEACVFDFDDKVIKCYYNNNIPPRSRKFYEYCIDNHFDVLPIVYRIGKGYVVMEKLKTNTYKIKTIFEQIFKLLPGQKYSLYHLVQDRRYKKKDLNKSQSEAVKFMEEVRKALADYQKVDVNKLNDFGDFNQNNIGQRKDGTLVYFDI